MSDRENVILLTVDSLRSDHLSCLGYTKSSTPNIDALAGKGALFSQAFSNGGGSVSSFPSITTSTYASMNVSSTSLHSFWIKLSNNWPTIAQILKSVDFSTAAFKNIKEDLCSFFGYGKGFDVFEETIRFSDKSINKMYRKLQYLQGYKFTRANQINKKAVSWCSKTHGNFFLWLHYMDVHLPYNPRNISLSHRFQIMKLGQKSRTNPDQLSRSEIDTLIAAYDNEIHYLDKNIGDLLNNLKKIGITPENTFFIFLSDHGDQFMEHGEWGHGRLYDEILHVPLFFCGPNIKPNTVINEQVSLLDVPPTITHLLGIKEIDTFNGLSLFPFICGEFQKTKPVISEELGHDYSCRTQNWKYIRHDRIATHELYDLRADPNEQRNVVYDYPEIVKEFDEQLNEHIAIGKELEQSLSDERNLSNETLEFLKNFPTRSESEPFLSRVFGLPRHAD